METFTYVFRELKEPQDIAALLRIRHQSYFEEHRYGPERPFRVDLTTHDQRARHFGVFRGEELVGGFRVVFRQDQPAAPIVRGMRALIAEPGPDLVPPMLPSEPAVDLAGVMGPLARLVDAEVGRLVLWRPRSCRGLLREVLTLAVAVLYELKVRLYLFSCAVERAASYSAVVKPRWRFESLGASGFGSDAFQFPQPSHAFVAAPEDCSRFERALQYADQLAAANVIHVSVDVEASR